MISSPTQYIIKEESLNNVTDSNIKFIQTKSGLEYQYHVRINLRSERAIKSIVTPMKQTQTIIEMKDNYKATISLNSAKVNIPNEDFVLRYEVCDQALLKPSLMLIKHPKYKNDYAMYYSFNPYYNFAQQSQGKALSSLLMTSKETSGFCSIARVCMEVKWIGLNQL